jgi:hypothetical protein
MFLNATGMINDQYLLPDFLAEQRIDIALIYGSHLQPTKKWSTPAYTIYRTDGPRPPHGRTAVAVRSLIHHNKANIP